MRQITLLFGLLLLLLPACTPPKQPPLPTGALTMGIAHYTHPEYTSDLLAGYIPENLPTIPIAILEKSNLIAADTLSTKTKRHFVPSSKAFSCLRSLEGQLPRKQAALRTWAAVGRCMGVDLLIVPQLMVWREREGGELGAAAPAKIIMDTFIIDVRNETLISRSHYEEEQTALSENLLETGKFMKRGGKWITAEDLLREGWEKAVKDLGL